MQSVSEDSEIISDEEPGNFNELKSLIDSAKVGGTVKLTKNYTYSPGEANNINLKRLTIDGNGYTIDGGSASVIFNIPRSVSTVVFKNINFVNANKHIYLNANARASISNCNFSFSKDTSIQCWSSNSIVTVANCNFISDYRAIESSSSSIIKNCNFKDYSDYAIRSGGTVDSCTFEGKGTPLTYGSFIVKNSKFYCEYSNAIRGYTLTVDNCEFNSNGTSSFIYSNSKNGQISINNCRFHSTKGAALIYSTSDDLAVITNNIIVNDEDKPIQIMTLINANLRNNTLSHSDDYIVLSGESDYLNLVFLDNKTIDRYNSAKINVTATDDMGNKVIISKVYVKINDEDLKQYALDNGEFLYIPQTAGKYVFSGKSSPTAGGDIKTGIINFEADGYFGPFYVSVNGSDDNDGSINRPLKTFAAAVEKANLDGNVAKVIFLNGTHDGSRVSITKDMEIEGINNPTVDFTNLYTPITSSKNLILNGINFKNGGNLVLCTENVFVYNCSFDNVGSYYTLSRFKNITVYNSNFTNIQSTYVIDASYWYGNNMIIINNSLFDSNRNCIYSSEFSDILINNSIFLKNSGISVKGSGFYPIYPYYSHNNLHSLNISNSKFINNLNTAVVSPIVNVFNSTFENNKNGAISCEFEYGAKYVNYNLYKFDFDDTMRGCTVHDSKFINNSAQLGAAICSASYVRAYNTTFENNVAGSGGALYVLEGIILDDVKFINNSAEYGGAIFNHNYFNLIFERIFGSTINNTNYDRFLKNRYINITNVYFENNSARISGGAISVYYGNISNSVFYNNNAGYGGAIYINEAFGNNLYPNSIIVQNSKFEDNNARYGGGAITSVKNDAVTIKNNKFNGNTAIMVVLFQLKLLILYPIHLLTILQIMVLHYLL